MLERIDGAKEISRFHPAHTVTRGAAPRNGREEEDNTIIRGVVLVLPRISTVSEKSTISHETRGI